MQTFPLKYIAVDGPIGVGKTTLTKMIAEELGARLLLEPAEKNPFLHDFYTDRERNAFKTQLYFLLNRYQQQLELKRAKPKTPLTICDYTFAKDSIFAELNLCNHERSLYNTVFNLLKEKLPRPDMIVYLRADSKILLQRIKKRGIDYERSITENYLEELTTGYDKYFLNYEDVPLLVVDTSKQDYINNPEDFDNLKRAILSHRGGTIHLIAR